MGVSSVMTFLLKNLCKKYFKMLFYIPKEQ